MRMPLGSGGLCPLCAHRSHSSHLPPDVGTSYGFLEEKLNLVEILTLTSLPPTSSKALGLPDMHPGVRGSWELSRIGGGRRVGVTDEHGGGCVLLQRVGSTGRNFSRCVGMLGECRFRTTCLEEAPPPIPHPRLRLEFLSPASERKAGFSFAFHHGARLLGCL